MNQNTLLIIAVVLLVLFIPVLIFTALFSRRVIKRKSRNKTDLNKIIISSFIALLLLSGGGASLLIRNNQIKNAIAVEKDKESKKILEKRIDALESTTTSVFKGEFSLFATAVHQSIEVRDVSNNTFRNYINEHQLEVEANSANIQKAKDLIKIIQKTNLTGNNKKIVDLEKKYLSELSKVHKYVTTTDDDIATMYPKAKKYEDASNKILDKINKLK